MTAQCTLSHTQVQWRTQEFCSGVTEDRENSDRGAVALVRDSEDSCNLVQDI